MCASGPRNEPARARRRRYIKDRLSLSSVPRSEDEAQTRTRRYNLENHFGWVISQKTQLGDGSFPHLGHYYEKPNIEGRDFQKVTYVLYMEKGAVLDKSTALKQTQTEYAERGIIPTGDVVQRRIIHSGTKRPSEKKRRLIHEFYFVPRSRSPSETPKSRPIKVGDPDVVQYEINRIVSQTQMSELEKSVELEEKRKVIIQEVEKEKDDLTKKAREAIDNEARKARKRADRWALRAGAESPQRNSCAEECEKTLGALDKESTLLQEGAIDEPVTETKLTEGGFAKMLKKDSKLIKKLKPSEYLLKTPSGNNKYLYLSRDRQYRPKKRDD